jgi:hypothetical protein
MSGAIECKRARLAIGGEPRVLPAEVAQHVASCPQCARFRDETLAMEGRLKAALELPLHHFRKPAEPGKPAPRRLALAASVVLALLVGGGAWLFRPQPALAGEVIEHVDHEPGSWQQHEPVSPEALAAVLAKAGVRYDARFPVTYASPCPFRGHLVPHLVVQTERGPLTVILLAHVTAEGAGKFSDGKYHGVVLPAGSGSIAVLARAGQELDGYIETVLEGVR